MAAVNEATPRSHMLAPRARADFAALRLRGRDSNPDYLIQSQASYH